MKARTKILLGFLLPSRKFGSAINADLGSSGGSSRS
jgi:hypothetical protein